MDKVNGQDILSSSSLTFPKKLKTNRGRRMTTKEAILHMDTTIDKYNEGLSSIDIEAIEHLIDIAKRFDGAVKVEPIQDVTWLEHDSSVAIPRTVTKSTKTYKLYAIPKEVNP